MRVNDSRTEKPTPVRLRIAGPNGQFFAPMGRCADFPLGRNEAVGGHVYLAGKKYVYVDGSCEVALPTGIPLEIEISKGPLHKTVRENFMLGPGQMSLRFTIECLKTIGLLCSDSRCHFLTPHMALLEAACEDVDIVHLLAVEHDHRSEDGHRYRTIPNIAAFSGQELLLAHNGRAVAVNTFNTHPALGRLALLNCHRPVFPLSFGGDSTDDWSLTDWCNQCHRKNGLVVWCDAYRSESGLPGGEALVAAILGQVDALEFDARERSRPLLPVWYRLLNAGFRLPIVGGSGKDSNRIALGSMRTYVDTAGEPRNMAAWAEGVRRGRTLVTNGPLLELKVNGKTPGAVIDWKPGQTLAIEGAVGSSPSGLTFEIVVNGRVLTDVNNPESGELERALAGGGWIAARCRGSTSELDQSSPIFAHTSPVYITVDGKTSHADRAAIQSLRADVEQVRDWIESVGRFERETSKARLLELCRDALQVLAQRNH